MSEPWRGTFGSAKSNVVFYKPFDSFYLNPTIRVYHELLEAMANVTTVRIDNCDAHAREFRPVDVVVFTPFMCLGLDREHFERMTNRLRRVYDVPYLASVTFEACRRYLDHFCEDLARSRASLLLLLEYDLHDLTPDDAVLAFGQRETDYLLFAGPELFDLSRHEVGRPDQELGRADLDPVRVSRGFALLQRMQHRLASFPHVLGLEEFCPETQIVSGEPSRRLSVPGASYSARKAVVASVLRHRPLDYGKHVIDRSVARAANRLLTPRVRSRLLWSRFTRSIGDSRLSFTCGSSSGYLVRKFFEIPAFGSCLCTFQYRFLEHCGLMPNVHYLPIETIAEILEYVNKLDDSSFVDHVVQCTLRGRSVVLRNHSTPARFAQLEASLTRMAVGDFHGSFWNRGEYKFRDSPVRERSLRLPGFEQGT